jgi:hypothetical protein
MFKTGSYAWSLINSPLRFKEVTAPAAGKIGADTLALYAKDRSGVSGLFYKDDADVEHDLGALTSAAALTRVNDTNVTVTLGGSPTTALLAATSLTLGWTGQLSVARGGTGVAALSSLDHGAFGGQTDDDHTQYALLVGRAGGQTLIGGTASLEILTLQGSAHGDGGLIVLNNDTIVSTASDVAAVKVSPTFTGSSNVVRGIQSLPTFQPSASIGAAIAFSFAGIGDPATGKTISLLTGGAGAYQTGSSGGAITDGYGFYVDSPTLGSVKPTGSTGLIIQNQGASGITNVYGLQTAAQTGGTNNYGHFLNIMSGNTSRALLIGTSQLTDRHILAEIGGSWDTDSANAAGLYVTTTFTGQPSAAFGLVGIPTFTTEASTTTALAAANLSIARANPAGSATITTLAGGYFRCDYVSSTGAVTTGIALNVAPPIGFGTLRPTTQYGLFISDQGLTGITNAVAARFELPTNATNVFYIEFPTADNTDPTSGGGAATGRIKCLIGGNTRYIPYYT